MDTAFYRGKAYPLSSERSVNIVLFETLTLESSQLMARKEFVFFRSMHYPAARILASGFGDCRVL